MTGYFVARCLTYLALTSHQIVAFFRFNAFPWRLTCIRSENNDTGSDQAIAPMILGL